MWPERPNMKPRLNYIPANYYGLVNVNFLLATGILQFGITCLNSFLCIFNHIFTILKFGKDSVIHFCFVLCSFWSIWATRTLSAQKCRPEKGDIYS
jgi:hypothetical protein